MGISENVCNCKCDLSNQEKDFPVTELNPPRSNKNSLFIINSPNMFKIKNSFSSLNPSKHLNNNHLSPSNKSKQKKDSHIILIQSIYRGYIYRKVYPSIKLSLESLEQKKIECFKIRFHQENITKAEQTKGPFNPNGWKSYYSSSKSYLFTYDKNKNGIIFNCKILTYKDISYYIGSVNINYKRCGNGTLIDVSGIKCEGMWVDDKLNGWGRVIDTEGNLSEGFFINHYLDGKGEKYYTDGTVYKGDFVKGVRQGKGSEENREHYYNGEFYNDKKEGKGKLKYKMKEDSYVGDFKANAITGKGKYIWGNKDVYEGGFIGGKMHGKGKYIWADGEEYEGDYLDGLKEGKGVFKWSNGKVYSGTFSKGNPHGKGIFYSDGKKYSVVFVDGRMEKSTLINEKINTIL